MEETKMIEKNVEYYNRQNELHTGVIKDKIKVALASGTNEYVVVDEYLILRNNGTIESTYPYFIKKIL